MLEKIKNVLFSKYKKTDYYGLFITTFDSTNSVGISNGVLQADKNLDELIELLYNGLIAKENDIKKIYIDIIYNVYQQQDPSKFINLPINQYGVCLLNTQDPNKTGVILPATKGVNSMQEALNLIKQKHQLSGNVNIYTFSSDRIEIEL